MIRKLQDVNIQTKLFIVFGIVFIAGILAVSWNTWNLYQARQNVTDSISDTKKTVASAVSANRDQVTQTLSSSQTDVQTAFGDSTDQVFLAFNQTDELLMLLSIQDTFFEMEAIYRDYLSKHDQESIDAFTTVLSWLREDIPSIRDHATNDHVRQTMDDLLPEVDYQEQQFQQVVAAIDSDPEQAEQLAQDGIDRLIDNVYVPVNDQVVTQQQALMASINQTTTLMYDTSDQTSTEMESSLNRADIQMRDLIASTSAEMKATVDDVDTAFQQAILVSLLTVVLFIVAAIIVIAAIVIVARQIVQPVLKLSDVAVSIENEDYKKDETDLASISVRRDEIGTLARVFDRMAKEVYSRVEKLKQQVAELKIVIDEGKMAAQVSEITDSEYFTDLQSKVKSMRRRKTTETEAVNNPDTPPPSPDTSAS